MSFQASQYYLGDGDIREMLDSLPSEDPVDVKPIVTTAVAPQEGSWTTGLWSELQQESLDVGVDARCSKVGGSGSAATLVKDSTITSPRTREMTEAKRVETVDWSWLNQIWNVVEAAAEQIPTEETMEIFGPSKSNDLDKGPQHTGASGSSIAELSPSLYINDKQPREVARCVECSVELALLLYHGSSEETALPHIVDLTCRSCFEHLDGPLLKHVLKVNPRPGRKRPATLMHDTKVFCDVCSHLKAYGGVRMMETSIAGRDSGRWIEPSFLTEVICDYCVRAFNICYRCPFDGRYRHGTWRPRELFDGKSRSCTLPHGKQLDSKADPGFVTYRLPSRRSDGATWDLAPSMHIIPLPWDPLRDLDPSLRLQQVFNNYMTMRRWLYFSIYATARMLRSSPTLWDWKTMTTIVDRGTRDRTEVLLGRAENESDGANAVKIDVQRYVTFCHHMRKVSRQRKRRTDDSVTNPEHLAKLPSWVPMIGYSFAEWYRTERHVYIGDSVSNTASNMTISKGLFASNIFRIDEECRASSTYQTPLYIWFYIASSLHTDYESPEGWSAMRYFRPIGKFCTDRSLDLDKMKSMLRREFSYAFDPSNSTVFVLDWEMRDTLRTESLW